MAESRNHAQDISLDPVTGLYDRRSMWSRLAEEVSRARRYQYPLSLMLVTFDIPHEGEVGEQVFQLAEILKRDTRAVDVLVRYSENSLVLLLPCTDEAGALVLAARIQRKAADLQPADGETEAAADISIGVTSAPGDYRGGKIALVEQMEWALRKAQKEKGERIVVVPAPHAQEPSLNNEE